MKETENRIAQESEELIDVDVSYNNDWVAVFKIADGHTIRTPNSTCLCPIDIRFPIVRYIDPNHILIADTTILKPRDNARDNAWIINLNGNIISTFCAGDGILDVFVRDKFIVFIYFDEGVFSGIKPSEQGVSVFDTSGNYLFGYYDKFGSKDVDIADCYCGCWGDGYDFWFCPYIGFPLVCMNIQNRTQQVFETPRAIAGSHAITKGVYEFYFYNPYDSRREILKWKPGDKKAKTIGIYSSIHRGLPDGQFLCSGSVGYTIVEMEPYT